MWRRRGGRCVRDKDRRSPLASGRASARFCSSGKKEKENESGGRRQARPGVEGRGLLVWWRSRGEGIRWRGRSRYSSLWSGTQAGVDWTCWTVAAGGGARSSCFFCGGRWSLVRAPLRPLLGFVSASTRSFSLLPEPEWSGQGKRWFHTDDPGPAERVTAGHERGVEIRWPQPRAGIQLSTSYVVLWHV